MGACCSIILDFSHDVRTFKCILVEFCFPSALVRYTWDCLWQFCFSLKLLVGTCSRCLIDWQLDSWLILRIASLANTGCDGVRCVVVYVIDSIANIDVRMLWQGWKFLKSKPCPFYIDLRTSYLRWCHYTEYHSHNSLCYRRFVCFWEFLLFFGCVINLYRIKFSTIERNWFIIKSYL